ncbi:hypothetical protein GCM10022404_19080 [Celeribacter arenosi]|uniref:Transcriptional regulator n=2 Tax=Celeribacter arenosi TaxID=792649 RepID=A0ABP7KB30_9RHOB
MPTITAATAATPAPVVITSSQYAWASWYAQKNGVTSVAAIARDLKVAPEVAQALFQKLVATGAIRAPAAGGLATASRPFLTRAGRRALAAKGGEAARRIGARTRRELFNAMRRFGEDDKKPETPETT